MNRRCQTIDPWPADGKLLVRLFFVAVLDCLDIQPGVPDKQILLGRASRNIAL
jgi:hypothetical protein